MLDFTGDNEYITVNMIQEWDGNLNNYAGGNKTKILIAPGPRTHDMDSRIIELENKVIELISERDNDKMMLEKHPGLKALHEQYRVMLALVNEKESEQDPNGV